MLGFLYGLIGLVPVVISQSCSYGGETCFCRGGSVYLTIKCDITRSEPSLLPDEFKELNLSIKYTIFYQFKNIPWIGTNYSLSKPGLQLELLDLSSNQIKTIEPEVFDQIYIRKLFMGNNSLINLGFLTPLCDLEELYIENTQVEYLNASWFRCKTKLTILSMRFNIIRKVGYQTFYGLIKLASLDIGESKIEILESEAFSNLPKLTNLRFCSHRIKEIRSYAFTNISSIKLIECLDSQFFETLPANTFNGLTKLESLRSIEGRLVSLSKDAFYGLTSLTKIELQKNLLYSIEPGAFNQIPCLKIIDLSVNHLTKLQRGVLDGLISLNNLTLAQNELETIEPFLFQDQRKSLEYLYLQRNKLAFIKKSFFSELRVLRELNVSYNQISSIEPGSFDNLVRLENLFLDQNCIFSIHPALFNNLVELYELTMSHNVIQRLDRSVFGGLSGLNLLDLSFNQIDSLPGQIFSNLSKLDFLGISNNRLKSLDSQLFQGLSSLKTLDLTNNRIEKMSLKNIDSFTKSLVFLCLESNNLVELEMNENNKYTSLSIIDISSNKKFINASRLMSNLAKCLLCKYDLYFQNMSTEFIYDLVHYFSHLPPLIQHIKILDLSYNDLSSLFDLIPFSAMASSLAVLRLEDTNIKSSVSFLKDLEIIKNLDLSNNQVALSSEYFTLKNIRYFFASNIGLKNITSELGRLLQAVNLDLSNNLIEVVASDNFDRNFYLSMLDLSNNRIRFIDDNAFDVSILSILDFSYNLLTSFSDSIFHNSISYTFPLKSLYLNNNKLSLFSYFQSVEDLRLQDNCLGEMIHDITVSKALNMDRNNITSISKSLISFYMTELSLSNNHIAQIDDNMFFEYYSLSRLDLSLNEIKILRAKSFRGLVVLEYLNLSSNLIEIVNQDPFQYVIKLIQLDLNNNKIKFIMDNSFASLAILQKLYLDSLQMTSITNNTFEGLESVKFLKINSIQFELLENVKIMTESLSKDVKSRNERYTWYSSTNIEFKQSVASMNSRYCSMVLFFAKNNILINLVSDLDRDSFISACRLFFFADLEYTKFGFA